MTVEEVSDPLDASGVVELLSEDAGRLDALLTAEQLAAGEPLYWITVLRDLRDVLRELQTLDAVLCRHIYLHGEHGDIEVDGVGRVKVYRSRASERWEGREAAFAAVDAKLTETGGELPDPMTVVEWVLDVVGIGYCRKNTLRALGLDPALFYESVPGKPKVDLPKRD